jgi:hypothetical protein
MLRRFRGRCAWMVVPLSLILVANPIPVEAGGRGGHGGGSHHSAPRPPAHFSAKRAPSVRVPHTASHAASVARSNGNVVHNNSASQNTNGTVHNSSIANNSVGTHNSTGRNNSASRNTNSNPGMSLAARVATIHPPTTYAYRSGNTTRNYRPSGYGRGYRNRYYGNSRNYGRSQSNDRSLVARLHSVHTSLTRLAHDYRGHRSRAAHHITLAIRHLSHSSMYSNSRTIMSQNNTLMGGVNGLQNVNITNGNRRQNFNGNTNGIATGNLNGNGLQGRTNQAQSDQRMAQALRTTQGVSMQLTHQSQNYNSHRMAQIRLRRAMHEMNLALATR